MEKQIAIDLSKLNGKFGQIILQRDYNGKTQTKLILGTINLERNVVQEFLWEDISLGGEYNTRIIDFQETKL